MPTVSKSHKKGANLNSKDNKRARDETEDTKNCDMHSKKQKSECCGHCDKFDLLFTSISKKLGCFDTKLDTLIETSKLNSVHLEKLSDENNNLSEK